MYITELQSFYFAVAVTSPWQQDVALIKGRPALTVFLMQMVLYNYYLFNFKTQGFVFVLFFTLKFYCSFQAPWSSVQEQPPQAEHLCTFSAGCDHKSNAEVRISMKQKQIHANANETMQK